jgi:hypothetical protein
VKRVVSAGREDHMQNTKPFENFEDTSKFVGFTVGQTGALKLLEFDTLY